MNFKNLVIQSFFTNTIGDDQRLCDGSMTPFSTCLPLIVFIPDFIKIEDFWEISLAAGMRISNKDWSKVLVPK